jgi:uncharacterized protein
LDLKEIQTHSSSENHPPYTERPVYPWYLNRLIQRKHNGLVKVVTGVRRCGKSYLLLVLFKDHLITEGVTPDHIIEMAFDVHENKKYRNPDVFDAYAKEKVVDVEISFYLHSTPP